MLKAKMQKAKSMNRWDLSDLHKNYDEAYKNLENVKTTSINFSKKYRGHIDDSVSNDFLENAISEYEKILDDMYKSYCYVMLDHQANLKDNVISKHYATIQEKVAQINKDLVFFSLAINKLSNDTIERCVKKYKPWVKQIRLMKAYELSEALEAFLVEKNITAHSAWVRYYDEMLADMQFTLNEKKVGIAKVLEGMSATSATQRYESAKALHTGLEASLKSSTFIYNTLIQDKMITDRKRGFKSPMQSRHIDNMIEEDVVETLAKTVKSMYPELSHRWYRIKAQLLGKNQISYWDRNAPLFVEKDVKIPYEEGKKIVYEAYSSFSPEMASIAKKFYDHPWIDVPARDDKNSGAFSASTVPSSHPYVLLNYQEKIRDVATLAHELGHAIHQYLAREQGLLMAETPLTVAETASVFGEMLTFNHMKLSGKFDVKMLLASKIDDMINTVVRQISFYEFEKKVHNHRIKEGELSSQELNQCWREIMQESLGDGIKWDPLCDNYWSYISHFFHAPFYVYAYAFGDCLVNSLYMVFNKTDDKKGFEKKYLELLKAGGAKTYRELLEPFDLNPSDATFWKTGLSMISSMMDELDLLL